jgi:hypothetical protein
MSALENEAQLRSELERGRLAQEVMDNPVYAESVALMRQQIMDQWATSPARDTEGREKLWTMLKLLENLDGQLKTVMQTGKLASISLEQKRTMLQRMREFL